MVNIVNIKTKIYILGISAALILCGCENSRSGLIDFETEDLSSENTVYVSETEETVKTAETEDITEAEKTTEVTETPKTTEEPPYIPDDPFEVREYPDDKIVPAEWRPVYSFAEAAQHFNEIVSADVSNMDTADAIIALANKNVIFVDSFKPHFWKIDADHPYYSASYENPFVYINPDNYSNVALYPILLSPEYYTDIQEIYDLGSKIYIDDALNNEMNGFYYFRGKSTKPFIKENGVTYVDDWLTPGWGFVPFRLRSYIEIVNETENKCSFIWHIADWEMLNESEEEYEFFYYSRSAEAVYENGSWKLSKVYIEGYTLI